MKYFLLPVISVLLAAGCSRENILYESDNFVITSSKIIQGEYSAVVVSDKEIRSNYISTYEQPVPRVLDFKFSLNGYDNERSPGEDHHLLLTPEKSPQISPVYVFGKPDPTEALYDEKCRNEYLTDDVTVTVLADLRHVFKAFKETGYFTLYTGEKFYQDSFEGLYIAGSLPPLDWDFASLKGQERFMMTDPDNDGIYEITLAIPRIRKASQDDMKKRWTQKHDHSPYPVVRTQIPLINAMYRLSLDELIDNIRTDGAFMAGAKWPGVWTRDISYSIHLSLAALEPEASKTSLIHKVRDGRIIQDTGTGGSWPVSTDRMTWAIAAWELYCVTGDSNWLRESCEIIRNSAEEDFKAVRDPETGLYFGESSFLDWREQSYPVWMDPKDIYKSRSLGTNAVHFQTHKILEKMAKQRNEPTDTQDRSAVQIREAINNYLWIEERGYYGQFVYGRTYRSLSNRSETLGEALSILFGISDSIKSRQIMSSVPVGSYGIACIEPAIPNIPPYHNNGLWPFVVAYWTWAAKKTGHGPQVEHGIASLYRAAGLFLTNKENMVAGTGDYMGTQINSNRQLWSVAGNLSLIFRVFAGMEFLPDGIFFKPFIPEGYGNRFIIENFSYRNAILNIKISGTGDTVDSFRLNGRKMNRPFISGSLTGKHDIEIRLKHSDNILQGMNHSGGNVSPETPHLFLNGSTIKALPVAGADIYKLYRNATLIQENTIPHFPDIPLNEFYEYQLQAVDNMGNTSFLSEPVVVIPKNTIMTIQAQGPGMDTKYAGYTGKGYIPLSKTENRETTFNLILPESGFYSVDFRYANGSGPVNTDNKCAVRTLSVDGTLRQTVVMPQRGYERWDDWGYSNSQILYMDKGQHSIQLIFMPWNENMNSYENRALLDHMRIIFLPE
jgi:hypothetical protein